MKHSHMTDHKVIELEGLKQAIGNEASSSDVLSPQLLKSFSATLDADPHEPKLGETAPFGIHWCLNNPAVAMHELDTDGHPKRGDFLPHVPLPRRMWAGGKLKFLSDLRVGDTVTRHSRIHDVTSKDGRSGPLVFITVRHEISTARGVAIQETQDIVYRDAPKPGVDPSPLPTSSPSVPAKWSRMVAVSPMLLFRYSALTFNAHRIHYDRDYATKVEGYPGLVVHGPLQATLLLRFASELSKPPTSFEFRSIGPIFDGAPLTLNADGGEGSAGLWVSDANGRKAMKAVVQW